MVDFDHFLNTDITNYRVIFECYMNLLSSLSNDNYSINNLLKLNGSASKFIKCINLRLKETESNNDYLIIVGLLSNNIKQYHIRENRPGFLATSKTKLIDSYENVYKLTMELINKFNSSQTETFDIKLNGLFTPELIDKTQIKQLINDAIDLIEKDQTLSSKTKNKITIYLKKVIQLIDDSDSSWALVLGALKETIIILAALGSIAAGISLIIPAKDKLVQTTNIIEQSSITINYNTLNQTFNNSQKLEYNSQIFPNSDVMLPIASQNQLSIDKKDF